jgi:hypothetical protein
MYFQNKEEWMISRADILKAEGFISPPHGKILKGLWYEQNHWDREKGIECFIMYPKDSEVGYFLSYDPSWQYEENRWVFTLSPSQPSVCYGVRLVTSIQAELCEEALRNKRKTK